MMKLKYSSRKFEPGSTEVPVFCPTTRPCKVCAVHVNERNMTWLRKKDWFFTKNGVFRPCSKILNWSIWKHRDDTNLDGMGRTGWYCIWLSTRRVDWANRYIHMYIHTHIQTSTHTHIQTCKHTHIVIRLHYRCGIENLQIWLRIENNISFPKVEMLC